MNDTVKQLALDAHRKSRGKIGTRAKMSVQNKDELSIAYTPGVAEVCRAINAEPATAYDYTMKANTVAIVTDGTAVLGLGDIGPEAAMPVMEGKALIMHQFADVDAVPLCLATKDAEAIITFVRQIAPGFGAINLEDIAAPRCFQILDALQDLGIPVFHDDQHGSAIAALAGLLNALKVVGKQMQHVKIVIIGAGAAGTATTHLLQWYGELTGNQPKDILLVDSKGILCKERDDLDEHKQKLVAATNRDNVAGTLADALHGADVMIGLSQAGLVSSEMVASMAEQPIVFAMANPDPEILPVDAKQGGAAIVATGRSDFPNQINNSIVFPGLFRGLLDAQATTVTREMMLSVATAIASLVEHPSAEHIVPDMFDKRLASAVKDAVMQAHQKQQ